MIVGFRVANAETDRDQVQERHFGQIERTLAALGVEMAEAS